MGQMLLQDLIRKGLILPPSWIADNTMYLTITGSESFGVSSGDSDKDVSGFCIPPRNLVFCHLDGQIPGFGAQTQRFGSWQKHRVKDEDKGLQYDFKIYSIVKYFQLGMECNPDVI